MTNSIIHGVYQLIEYPEKNLVVLNEVFTKNLNKKRFCFLKSDMVDVNKVLQEDKK